MLLRRLPDAGLFQDVHLISYSNVTNLPQVNCHPFVKSGEQSSGAGQAAGFK
jgi:hypothetical protein